MTQNLKNTLAWLETANDIQHWNFMRNMCKRDLTTNELAHVDSCGLIVRVLGRDKKNPNEQ